jgi:hypothetical protein
MARPSAPAAEAITASAVVERLLVRYQPPEWFTTRELTLGNRRVDFAALSCWRTRGYRLVGAEIKVSRADWLRELQEHEKSRGWTEACDEFYIVAPKGIVQRDEVPREWGFLELVGARLMTRAYAPSRDRPADVPREVFARIIGRLRDEVERVAVTARMKVWNEAEKRGRESAERDLASLRADLASAERQLAELRKALGVESGDWRRHEKALTLARFIAPIIKHSDTPEIVRRLASHLRTSLTHYEESSGKVRDALAAIERMHPEAITAETTGG